MPSPPITIGELTDVPTPNSPINAQFMQETANRIVHRFASVAAMNGWAAANGSLAFVAPTYYAREAGVWKALTYKSELDTQVTLLQNQINSLNAAVPGYTSGTSRVDSGHVGTTIWWINTGVPANQIAAVLSVDVFEAEPVYPPGNHSWIRKTVDQLLFGSLPADVVWIGLFNVTAAYDEKWSFTYDKA